MWNHATIADPEVCAQRRGARHVRTDLEIREHPATFSTKGYGYFAIALFPLRHYLAE